MGLLFVCCQWVPRTVVHQHTLGICLELGYKQEEKVHDTQWQFPSFSLFAPLRSLCWVFNHPRAVSGGLTAPKLCSLLRGFDFVTAGIFGSGMEMRIDVLWMKPLIEKWLSQLPVEEKVFSWLCYHWNRLRNEVLPPCREVRRAFAHLHVQARFIAKSPLRWQP